MKRRSLPAINRPLETSIRFIQRLGSYEFGAPGNLPSQDQSSEIEDLITGSAPGATVTLPAGDIHISSPIYLSAAETGKTVKGHASGTRIIPGITVPKVHVRPLSIKDPLFARFKASCRKAIRCVDLNAIGVDPGAFPDTDGKHNGQSFEATSDNVIRVQVGERSLIYAAGTKGMGAAAWRVVTGVGADPKRDVLISTEVIPAGYDGLRAILFDTNDYAPMNFSVEGVDPANSKIMLGADAGQNLAGGNKHRIKLCNAPEFLTQPGEMVLLPDAKKLYFIPPNGGEVYIGTLRDYVFTTNDAGGSSPADGLIFEDLDFTATPGAGIHANDGNAMQINNCTFEGFGSQAITYRSAGSSTITGCRFSRCLRTAIFGVEARDAALGAGALQLDGPMGALGSLPPFSGAHASGNITQIEIIDCTFSDHAWFYISHPGAQLGNASRMTGILYQGNTFLRCSGAAIGIGARDTNVTTNIFQDCVMDVTDYGAVYGGRSALRFGLSITDNGFYGCQKRHATTQSDNVAGVMLDDGFSGFLIEHNWFESGDYGIISNGSRLGAIRRNKFKNCARAIRSAYFGSPETFLNELLALARTPGYDGGFWLGAGGDFPPLLGAIADAYYLSYDDTTTGLSAGDAQDVMDLAAWRDDGTGYMINEVTIESVAEDLDGTPGPIVVGNGGGAAADGYSAGASLDDTVLVRPQFSGYAAAEEG